jgi:hypothetical protein
MVAFLLVMIVIGAAVFKRIMDARQPATSTPMALQQGYQTVTLFFADERGLARELREIAQCDTPTGCIEALVAELANGPVSDLQPVIPADSALEDVKLEGDTAVLHFSLSFAHGIPAGSSAEMTAVYAVVNTICLNDPRISKVRFMEGDAPLKLGHLDLTEPLGPDFSLERH